jgi:hypothetical protein
MSDYVVAGLIGGLVGIVLAIGGLVAWIATHWRRYWVR